MKPVFVVSARNTKKVRRRRLVCLTHVDYRYARSDCFYLYIRYRPPPLRRKSVQLANTLSSPFWRAYRFSHVARINCYIAASAMLGHFYPRAVAVYNRLTSSFTKSPRVKVGKVRSGGFRSGLRKRKWELCFCALEVTPRSKTAPSVPVFLSVVTRNSSVATCFRATSKSTPPPSSPASLFTRRQFELEGISCEER